MTTDTHEIPREGGSYSSIAGKDINHSKDINYLLPVPFALVPPSANCVSLVVTEKHTVKEGGKFRYRQIEMLLEDIMDVNPPDD